MPPLSRAPNFLMTVVLLVVTGCASNAYRPSDLPPDMLVGRVEGLHKIDLSRLAKTASSSEQIHVGDVLEVAIATGIEDRSPPSWALRVSESGEVNIPLVGPIRVAGMLLTDAEKAIRHESVARQVYRDPNVSVLLKQPRQIRVTVVGAVAEPGTYELPASHGDLLTALIAAGGLSEDASAIVEIRSMQDPGMMMASYNGQRTTLAQHDAVRVDLIAASEGMTPEYHIEDGSIVMVREKEPTTIQVIGLVRKPNQFEIPPERQVRLLDAIALAGGLTLELADKVTVIRHLDDMAEPIVIQCSIRSAKRGGSENLMLAAGDVVSVEETPLTFTIGTVQSFVRFGFSSAIPGI